MQAYVKWIHIDSCMCTIYVYIAAVSVTNHTYAHNQLMHTPKLSVWHFPKRQSRVTESTAFRLDLGKSFLIRSSGQCGRWRAWVSDECVSGRGSMCVYSFLLNVHKENSSSLPVSPRAETLAATHLPSSSRHMPEAQRVLCSAHSWSEGFEPHG